ncbi:MAG: fructose-bisphosphate aldolase class I [Ardenticatenia bacterium]|nr:fructose-bisphosphate aldolase class I [Ardenticatenia bacterium]
MSSHDLAATALALVADGKGILAADESTGTIKKRFDGIGLASTAETRRAYRQLLFTAPDFARHISGVILYDETLRQADDGGKPFPRLLADMDVLPGIKVDTGAKPLAGHAGETVTEGLDGLRERLAEYVALGARFAKWRAVIDIAAGLPSEGAIVANAHALARYAALCQEAGVVPIVEPEVLMDGDHGLERCEEVTARVLRAVFHSLNRQGVMLEGMLLKPNMVIPGKGCPDQASPERIAAATLRCFRQTVPAAVPGIVFLSGGQSAEEATVNLNAMNAMGPQPWKLSFSYGRALQQPALAAWGGQAANVARAQDVLRARAAGNGAAALGSYSVAMEAAG